MARIRKVVSALFISLFTVSAFAVMTPIHADGEGKEVHVGDWAKLKDAVKNAGANDKIIIDNDITTNELDNRVISNKKVITVDLNGHSIKKNEGTKFEKNGHIFEIQGNSKFTLIDSVGGGTLEQGCGKKGGAINIHDGSTVTIKNITFQNNRAGVDGGAIYNSGTLIMEDCKITSNTAEDTGGGIFNGDDAKMELKNVEIDHNISKNDGGGLNIHTDGTSKIEDCYIHDNVASDEGGGFRYDADDETLELYNTTIENNWAKEKGGAFFLELGNVYLYGCDLIGNKADEHGGAIFSEDNLEFRVKEGYDISKVEANTAGVHGGGIFSKDSTVIKNVSIKGNKSEKHGAGLYVEKGTTEIDETTITENRAELGNGGGIFIKDGTLKLRNVDINKNFAYFFAGGVFCDKSMDKLYVQKKPVIKDNKAAKGSGIVLNTDDTITLDGKLEAGAYFPFAQVTGKDIYHDDTGNLTDKYDNYNKDDDYNQFFVSTEGYRVRLDDGDVETYGDRIIPDRVANPVQTNSFIPWNEQVNTDYENLDGSNWLSGISGERKLNEINTPMSHDSAMKDVASATKCIGSSFNYFDNAVTQYEYIYQQLLDGVRYFDLRLNNKRPWKKNRSRGDQTDDGQNLFLCHGKNNKAGTYFAKDPETGYPLNFETVLKWVQDFLTNHPTEYVMLSLKDECQHDYDVPKIYTRLNTILKKHVDDMNPSTGERFFYLQDDEYGKEYNDWPQLKDVRGKIVIKCKDTSSYGFNIGGLVSTDKHGEYYSVEQEGSMEDSIKSRTKHVDDFVKKEIGIRDLPTDASRLIDEKTGKEIFIRTSSNCVDAGWFGIPGIKPLEGVAVLNPHIYLNNTIVGPINNGKFIGWWSSDGMTAIECAAVFRTNYFDGLEYKTVTIKSNRDSALDQVYSLLKGTKITIPGYIYDYEQNDINGYFEGWYIGETKYSAGDEYIITDDVVFDANWSNTEVVSTEFKVVWQDADNKDNLRPNDEISITVNGSYNTTIDKNNKWSNSIPVEAISADEIVVTWDKASANIDGDGIYKYEVTGSNEEGWTITLIHTPSTLVEIQSKITFFDNVETYRPETVTIGIYELGGNRVDEQTYTVSADGINTVTFELPQYKDGKEIQYEIKPESFTSTATTDITKYGRTIIDNIDVEYSLFNMVDVTVKVLWTDVADRALWTDIIEANRPVLTDIRLKDKSSEYYELSHRYSNLKSCFVLDNGEDSELYDEGLSEYYFKIVGEIGQNPDDTDPIVDITKYELIINDVIPNIHFNIFMNEDGYYVIANANEYSSDYGMVIELIDSIGEVNFDKFKEVFDARFAYNLLAASSKEQVTNFNKLEEAEKIISDLMNTDVFAAIKLIDSIGEIEYTEECKAKIDAAGALYEGLEEYQKLQVINFDVLVKATSDYEFLRQKEVKIQKKVDQVIELIEEIGAIDYNSDFSYSNIDDARSAYELLPADRVNLVSNYDKLVESEAEYYAQYFIESLKNIYTDANLCDGHETDLATILPELSASWDALKAEVKEFIVLNDSTENIAKFNTEYKKIMGRYTTLTPFTDGPQYSVELKTIALSGYYKTEFTVGDTFSYDGLVVTATYYDNTTKAVTGYTVTGYNKDNAGEQTITVTYAENGVTKTGTYKITVKQATPVTPETPTESKGLSTGAIVGIAVGSTALVAAIAVGVWFFIKKRH